MKTACPELIALLANSSGFAMADCYAFDLASGERILANSSDVTLSVDGTLYPPGGGKDSEGQSIPLIERSKTRLVRGVQVDSLEVQMYLDATHCLSGTPILTLLRNGGFDGARMSVFRVFMEDWGSPVVGAVSLFSGRISDVEITRTSAKLTVKSDLELLNVKMPHRLYQAGCPNTVFDLACGLKKSDFTQTGMVTGPSTRTTVTHSNPAEAGYFAMGVITWMTGANAGVSRTVRDSQQGSLSLSLPLPAVPATSDTFEIWPGCDKTIAACQRFGNVSRHAGCPFIPVPETAY